MLKGCRFPAGAGTFAVTCERELIVQPAKDGGFFTGRIPASQASGSAVSAEASRYKIAFFPAYAGCRGDLFYD